MSPIDVFTQTAMPILFGGAVFVFLRMILSPLLDNEKEVRDR